MPALRWSNAARRDLLEIWSWRGRDYPERGDRALDRIETACRKLERFPHLGPPFPRVAPDARKLTVAGHLVLYRIDPDAVTIVRVVDQRRLLEKITFTEKWRFRGAICALSIWRSRASGLEDSHEQARSRRAGSQGPLWR